jgi:hypothetical protein
MSSLIRLHIIAEGQTEERFVKDTLVSHLSILNVFTDVRCVLTSKDKHKKYRGGLIAYQKAKSDIQNWLASDANSDARFTTMFDLYALPNDFPGFGEAIKKSNPYEKIKWMEQSLFADINDHRFIPYIQLHEFEALLFSKPSILKLEYFDHDQELKELELILKKFSNNPELINDKPETAPSKRIINLIPEYEGNKVNVGAVIASLIGLEQLRKSCLHFNEWLIKLENLSTADF